jgi:hypothetical protein
MSHDYRVRFYARALALAGALPFVLTIAVGLAARRAHPNRKPIR